MHKPQSSTELRRSLRYAVECAERALASERKDSLAGIRIAFTGLQDAVDAIDAARLEWFEISSDDERELRALVHHVQSLVEELLLKVETWRRPGSAAHPGSAVQPSSAAHPGSAVQPSSAVHPQRASAAKVRWLN